MYFVFPALVFVLIYVGQELGLRKKSGLALTTWSELLNFLTKHKRASVYPKLRRAEPFYLFAFAFVCSVLFAVWESFLWTLFGRDFPLPISVIGLGLLALMILRRRQKQVPLGLDPNPYRELLAVWTGVALSMQPVVAILFFTPWIAYRAKNIRGL